jgi:hypothetical protein
MLQGLKFAISILGFGFWGLGSGVWGSEFGVWGSELGVCVLGFEIEDSHLYSYPQGGGCQLVTTPTANNHTEKHRQA